MPAVRDIKASKPTPLKLDQGSKTRNEVNVNESMKCSWFKERVLAGQNNEYWLSDTVPNSKK